MRDGVRGLGRGWRMHLGAGCGGYAVGLEGVVTPTRCVENIFVYCGRG